MAKYEMDDVDRELLKKCAKAVAYFNNGDPMKDVLDQDEMEDAIRLLVSVTRTKVPSLDDDDE